jgi:hypothetical protein
MSQALQEDLLVKQSKVQYKKGIHPLNAGVLIKMDFCPVFLTGPTIW